MKRKSQRGIAVAVFMSLVVFPLTVQAVARSDGHDFPIVACVNCHEKTPIGDVIEPTVLKENIHAECVNCHKSCDSWTVHRGESPARIGMEKKLPLDRSGEIACYTCHDTHGAAFSGGVWNATNYLRLNNLKRELCLNCHHPSTNGHIEVVSPPSGVFVNEKYVLLAGTVVGEIGDHLDVRLNGTAFPLRIKGGLFYTWLRVQDGANTVELELQDVVQWRGEVFKADPSSGATSDKRLYRGHQVERGDCRECHQEVGETMTGVSSATPDLCYRCHQPFMGKKFVHGPVAVGDCLLCHDPHGGIEYSSLKEPGDLLCASCHGEERTPCAGSERSAGACISCHDPHQSDFRFFRRKPQTASLSERFGEQSRKK